MSSPRVARTLAPPLVILLIALGACQGKSLPTDPGATAGPQSVDPHTVALGAFDLVIDSSIPTATLELLAVRSASAIGDSYLMDLTPSASKAVRLLGIQRGPDNTLELTIGTRNPVPLPDPENPKPGDRLDLHVTDVMGVLLIDGPAMDSGLSLADPIRAIPGVLVNADGYTGMLSGSFAEGYATEANIHPYRILSLDTRTPNYDPASANGWTDLYNPIGFNVLPQGGAEQQTIFRLALPAGETRMRLAVQAQIAVATESPSDRMNPKYCYPEGLLKSAVAVGVRVANNGLQPAGDPGLCTVLVEAWDWQERVATATSWSADETPGLVRAAGDIKTATISIPALGGGTPWGEPLYGAGSSDDPALTVVHYTPGSAIQSGTTWGFARVGDMLDETTTRGHGGDFSVVKPVTYQTFQVTVREIPAAPIPLELRLGTENCMGFIPPEGELQLAPVVYYSDGSTRPASGLSYRVLDPERISIDANGLITRLLPGDEQDLARYSVMAEDPEGLFFRGDWNLALGSPYPLNVNLSGVACGASGSQDPSLALGGPRGSGPLAGSTHTVSLGYGGQLLFSWAWPWGYILDKPGPDFIVFENAFDAGGDPLNRFTETCTVEVSTNGTDWVPFPPDYRPDGTMPWTNPANFTNLAGVSPVFANVDENSIDPTDPAVAGGDAFDLAEVGLSHAKYVRLTATGIDASSPCFSGCPSNNRKLDKDGDLIDDAGKHGLCSGTLGGPDIDAVAVVRGHLGLCTE